MKEKMNKNTIPSDFTISLALFDFVPVLLFGLSMIVFSSIINNYLFLIGSLLCLWAGFAKVLWKMIVVLRKNNIWFLFVQMRIVMPMGLLIMIISLVLYKDIIDLNSIIICITKLPSIIFFVLGVVCMILMLVFGFVLNNKEAKNNWIEQIVNSIGQLCFFIGLLLIKFLR